MSTIDDPFVSSGGDGAIPRDSHRYSSFDDQLFNLDASSPAQAKRALEAHLAETERRLEEASKLGTALVEQQKELEDKLKEVEQQQEEGQIGPDLRRKLADLEKEYNEIGRETTRAFLAPKRLAGGDDAHPGTPSFDQKSPLSAAFFASQATNSPSKVSVPSRKQRNQPSSRVHDIEFATEISTSLLAQVRQLQALLAEREDALKTLNLEKSRLELEAEGYAQRIRALDESEERYKDENWALETRTHELLAAVKDGSDRESRLSSSLGAITSEKNAVERELEDLKQTNTKLVEDQAAAQKANDAELHLLRRNLNAGEAERQALQKKWNEVNAQNEELAKAVAMRLRQHEHQSTLEVPRADRSDDSDQGTPDNSPPPSPNKFTPRHGHLETETLRSSLGHAHRMIQNLKSTIHREKTEKIELKRMLQDARDEVELRRRDGPAPTGGAGKRQRTKTDAARKAPRPDLLGAGRRGGPEVEVHADLDPDWEDHAGEASPSHKAAARPARPRRGDLSSDEPPSSAYQTATEADDTFETANERETTESEAFQTGVESMADDSTDSDELTETEDRRSSWQSTASTSADENDSDATEYASPSQNSTPRYRPRKKRSVPRRIRPSGEAPMAFGSRPSSARESPATSFTHEPGASEGQSLFAELAELDGEEEDGDYGSVTDSRRPSAAPLFASPRPTMVDSGVMTDPWEPAAPAPVVTEASVLDEPSTPRQAAVDADTAVQTNAPPALVHSGTQWTTPLKASPESNDDPVSNVPTPPKMTWDEPAVAAERGVEAAPTPQLEVSVLASQETLPVAPTRPDLCTSYCISGMTEPIAVIAPEPPTLHTSAITAQFTVPVAAPVTDAVPVYTPSMAVSSVVAQHTEPVAEAPVEPAPRVFSDQGTSTDLPELVVSSLHSVHTEPVVVDPTPASSEPVDLTVSLLTPAFTVPIAPVTEEPASSELVVPALSLSRVRSVETLPVRPRQADTVDRKAPTVAANVPLPDLLPAAMPTPSLPTPPVVAVPAPAVSAKAPGLPLGPISGNAGPRHAPRQSSTQTDQGAQTILSSKQIDQILMDRITARPLSPPDSDRTKEQGTSPFATPKARTKPAHHASTASLSSIHRRPGSAASQTSSVQSHPPLPADHRENIIAAEKKTAEHHPVSPGLMGPPLAPASAYRTNATQRPRTPNGSSVHLSAAPTTASRTKSRRESQVSRRSSVSSFASEIEERFNMQNPHHSAMPHGYGPGSDPRMIQAITQTMIGEFLWKYTRKTVSGEISNTRHRRYFWIHPYTRTLYWSTQDPQSAGKHEIRTKSVPIEAVRVVADDNPYPPGLHCKSLEVVSPGRRIRFTATTSQRHETWYNSLSYLLVRGSEDDEEDPENITLEDIDEFNPGFRSRSRGPARLSVSSSQSRPLRNSGAFPQQRAGSAMSLRRAATPGRASPAPSTLSNYSEQGRRSASRLSSILNTTIKGSFGRKGRSYAGSSVNGGSVRGLDSQDDLRQMVERQEREDGLENVRACCDGKHDVGSLSRTSRYSPRANRIHSHH
ncbi:hypothetical protein P168DRAFT_325086 [Aspergillus campestris IBT 28561]|uniref:PH domain-containing protein n=1 Tax=Aspergillus campestris (strain IBT 28561) TaxID=1392248 RepID=A0A2I1D8I1_ASPC2|nr:uncharacterized protein P168DRAFT_325086 [Aspergillus campestris IBT 28561]PKY06193.1 hypothetical protein P168DRAFT_325086 [Aspergillus campestris IBT 28561]